MAKNLLLADDSITIQKVVGITFANEDFKVTTVDNGEDAVARARELKPDIILADVVMPRKNGYEVCEAVKGDPGLRHIPVLLLAGTFEAFDEARARNARADGHIAKPFESQALINKVRELTGGTVAIPAGAPAAARPAAPAAAPAGARPPGPGTPPFGAPRPGAPMAPPAGARPPGPGMPPPGAPRPGGPFPPGARPAGPGMPPPGMAQRPPGPGMPPGGARPGAPMAPGARPPGPGMPQPGMQRPPGPGMPQPGMQRPPGPGMPPPGARPRGPGMPPQGMRPGAPPPGAAPQRPASRPASPPAAGAPAPTRRDPFGFGVGGPAKPPAPAPEEDFGDIDVNPSAAAAAPPPATPAFDELAVDVEPGPSAPRAPIELPDDADSPEAEFAPMHAFVPPPEAVGHRPEAVPAAARDGGEAALRDALSNASREVIERIVLGGRPAARGDDHPREPRPARKAALGRSDLRARHFSRSEMCRRAPRGLPPGSRGARLNLVTGEDRAEPSHDGREPQRAREGIRAPRGRGPLVPVLGRARLLPRRREGPGQAALLDRPAAAQRDRLAPPRPRPHGDARRTCSSAGRR